MVSVNGSFAGREAQNGGELNINATITYILDLTIAVLFFIPFYMKLRSYEGFKLEIYSYGVLSPSLLSLGATIVLIVELLLFFFFATGLANGIKHLMGIGLLVVFTFLTWRKKRITGLETCACYGSISFLNRFPIYRNLVLITLLLIDFTFYREIRDFYHSILLIFFVMALSFSIEIVKLLWERNEA
ncbi:MauE/DoxX family redox-associated membrane protein [Paenibacillus glacialis]|uniref:Methylamine utilisation protein MauE domain-containing protein n=1 Tax=Paenibacillus glacialis TaxID=494026 RepID=A0A168KHK0_9BACL|nr:MauE/DoxX family redox-associated membrane protein [Paenibacillus glacialis]OAB42021.1 hypothetical protein PGLA_14495 [Paenibacillus glacialis]